MNKKRYFYLIILIFISILNTSRSKELLNNIIVSIDNTIITELDLNKEANFIKFITKNKNNPNLISLKQEALSNLIDRKIKDKETQSFKIEILEKEVEINLYNYLNNQGIKFEDYNKFCNENEVEKDYLLNLIRIDMKWSQLIRNIYTARLNVNLTEINKEISKGSQNTSDYEKLRKELILSEQNILLNKFSATHLEKSKKKYLIKFL
jgi:hypothetical protein